MLNRIEEFVTNCSEEIRFHDISCSIYNPNRFGLAKKFKRQIFECRTFQACIEKIQEFEWSIIQCLTQVTNELVHQELFRALDRLQDFKITVITAQTIARIECEICFDQTQIATAIHCELNDQHSFCHQCVQQHAKEQIHGLGKHYLAFPIAKSVV